MDINLEAAERRIFTHGPDRVLINKSGAAVRPKEAECDVIFIRNDGWSLGAPARLVEDAYKLWQNEWVAFITKGEQIAKPITQWTGKTIS
jgi:hypothetical protein